MFIWLCKIYLVRSTSTPVCGQNVGLGVRAHRIANWLCTLSAQTPLWQASEPSPLCNSPESFELYVSNNTHSTILPGKWWWVGQRVLVENLKGWPVHSYLQLPGSGWPGPGPGSWPIHSYLVAPPFQTSLLMEQKAHMHAQVHQWIKWICEIRSIQMHLLKFKRC